MLLVYDAMTGGIWVEAENSKRKHGERFRERAIQEAWNKRGHKVPVSSKARVVIQGFKEDKEELDGPGFIYNSNVVGLAAVRRAMLGGRRPGHSVMQVDISTAFLQSDLFSLDDPPR